MLCLGGIRDVERVYDSVLYSLGCLDVGSVRLVRSRGTEYNQGGVGRGKNSGWHEVA